MRRPVSTRGALGPLRTGGAVIVAASALVLSGCWGHGPGQPAPSSPRTVSTPSPVTPSTGATVMDCTDPIDESVHAADGMKAVLDVVAFTTERTQPVASGHGLWSKTGIQLRSGARFELRSLTPGVTFNWSNTGDDRFTARLVVEGCHGSGASTWLTYPGGFELTAPVCAEIEVIVGDTSARTGVPLGVDC